MKTTIRLSGLWSLNKVAAIILLTSCSRSIAPDNEILVDPVPTPSVTVTPVASIPSLNLGQSDDTGFLEKEVANLRAIPLETTDDCLIGQISDLFLFGDTLVVVDGKKSKQIYLYNIEGKFLNKFGRVGVGPGEYMSISRATIDSNRISILDYLTLSYIDFDYAGNIVNSMIFTSTSPSRIMPQNDSILVATYASYFESSPFALQWLEGDSVVATALPYSIKRSEIAPSMFRLNDREIGLHIPTVDTIYSITGRQIVPKYKLGLITDEEAQDWRRISAKMNVSEQCNYRIQGHYIPADFVKVYPLEDYFVISHQKGMTCYIGVVDRKTLQSRNYLQSSAMPLKLFMPPYIKSANGNTLIGFMAEDYFIQASDESRAFIEKHFSEHDQEILKNYDYDNNNPIVWLMELK